MIECLIIGDSIAVGTAQSRPECIAYAKGGWNTWQWNKEFLKNNLSAKTVIISLGSNDHKGVKTKAELQRIREKVGVNSKVFWILPAIKPRVQDIVYEIAFENNDVVIPIRSLQKDKVHPDLNGYQQIAKRTRK
jgi:lysophospholipase L1-like esterase